MRTRILGGVLAVATAAALAAGCSNTPTPPAGGSSAASPTPSPAAVPAVFPEHNPGDIAFVQGMTPHHSQAIAMSQQAASKASSPEVKQLASRFAAAQGPEINQMHAMLTAWGVPPTPAMPKTGSMPGMMSGEQMTQLAGASGPAFDRMFLQMMTAHHQGAIEMARTELSEGQNPQAKQLARSITAAQQAEINEMSTLLQKG
jgi:uncharacterized protein (DUF305 family)